MFEKRIRRDVNGFYQVQIRHLPVEDWEPLDGWRTVFISSIYENATTRLAQEPGHTVTTICYGQEKHWENRWDAIDFFKEGAMACDGSEKERYTNILLKLLAGEEACSDETHQP